MIRYLISTILLVTVVATAQDAPAQKSLASTLNVYVFPSQGQDSSQQSKDESACYQWAVTNSGVDPFAQQKQAQSDDEVTTAQMQAAEGIGTGAGAAGAVRGTAAGALIGGIAGNDVGHSAGVGAAVGLVHNRRRARAEQRVAEASVASSGAAKSAGTAENLDNFKKAYSVCLEGKNYTVKY